MAGERVALVTGASRGLGFGVCRRLGRAGLRIVAACRDEEDGERVVKALAADRVDARNVVLDVTDARQVEAVRAGIVEGGEGLDVLVNNAGISMKGFDGNVAEGTLAVNYFGAVRVTEALGPLVRRGGRVVMVSSGMGELSAFSPGLRSRFLAPELDRRALDALANEFIDDVKAGRHAERGWPTSAYRVSKAALNAYVRLLAPELAPREILVNAVCPGWVRTDMGGAAAPRELDEGVEGIAWAALLSDGGPTGGFFRDGKRIPW